MVAAVVDYDQVVHPERAWVVVGKDRAFAEVGVVQVGVAVEKEWTVFVAEVLLGLEAWVVLAEFPEDVRLAALTS